jgi:hypothetical protein
MWTGWGAETDLKINTVVPAFVHPMLRSAVRRFIGAVLRKKSKDAICQCFVSFSLLLFFPVIIVELAYEALVHVITKNSRIE